MDDLWFSPLAPAVMFLAGAFIVRIVPNRFHVGLATTLLVFMVLISRILLRGTYPELSGLTVFSGWSFVHSCFLAAGHILGQAGH
jgi:hypothetical protein